MSTNDVFTRLIHQGIPHILEQIVHSLSVQDIQACRKVSPYWEEYLDSLFSEADLFSRSLLEGTPQQIRLHTRTLYPQAASDVNFIYLIISDGIQKVDRYTGELVARVKVPGTNTIMRISAGPHHIFAVTKGEVKVWQKKDSMEFYKDIVLHPDTRTVEFDETSMYVEYVKQTVQGDNYTVVEVHDTATLSCRKVKIPNTVFFPRYSKGRLARWTRDSIEVWNLADDEPDLSVFHLEAGILILEEGTMAEGLECFCYPLVSYTFTHSRTHATWVAITNLETKETRKKTIPFQRLQLHLLHRLVVLYQENTVTISRLQDFGVVSDRKKISNTMGDIQDFTKLYSDDCGLLIVSRLGRDHYSLDVLNFYRHEQNFP